MSINLGGERNSYQGNKASSKLKGDEVINLTLVAYKFSRLPIVSSDFVENQRYYVFSISYILWRLRFKFNQFLWVLKISENSLNQPLNLKKKTVLAKAIFFQLYCIVSYRVYTFPTPTSVNTRVITS